MSHDEESPKSSRNWLQRLLDRAKGDVVIAQVGPDARNVVIGTRNVQINIGGRNLTVPVLLVPLLLLVVIGILLYPTVIKPRYFPERMDSTFNIAVAEIGQLSADGRVHPFAFGRRVSQAIGSALCRQYSEFGQLFADENADLLIWSNREQLCPKPQGKLAHIGVIYGRTAKERRQNAEALRARINADMLIYGYVRGEDNAETPESIDLQFVYSSRNLNSEFDLIVGDHTVGGSLPLPIPYQADAVLALNKVSNPLGKRSTALFWIATGLVQELIDELGRSERFLKAAATELANEQPDAGQSILYFLLGRVSLYQEKTDQALAYFQQAVDANPDYTRARIALGSAYLQKARALSHVERRNQPEVLEQAVHNHEIGLNMALAQGDAFLEALGRLALAKSYRLVGTTDAQFAEYDAAEGYFLKAMEQLESATVSLEAEQQYRLLAQAYEARGAIFQQQAQILRNQQRIAESRQRFEEAKAAYNQCVDQGARDPYNLVLKEQIIEQFCRPNIVHIDELLQELAGG
ncbi:MAG: hypothetical protein R3A44_43805 [Caldilineaceae bacterium]